MDLTPGSHLGRYEVRSRLGAGGMGEVFVAYDPELEREVAIKVIRDATDDTSERGRRFVQEAKASSALNHPNVAQVYEIGSQDGNRFIVMELVTGETLRARMRRGPIPLEEALSLGTQIAAGLAAAHEAGIIHRDVKPENVMIRSDGYAKVLDFGLAKLRELRNPDAATLLHTRPGAMMGTIGYMSPEQISGEEVTPATDVFSVGILLYEMVTGHRPFEGRTATEVSASVLTATPRPPSQDRPGTPPKLSAVITKALEKEVEQRYANAGALLSELRLISSETTAAAMRIHDDENVAQVRRARARRWLPLAIALLLLAGGAIVFSKYRSAKRVQDARTAVATAEELLAQRKYGPAYASALAASKVLPNEMRARDVLAKASQQVSIKSDPPGATVYAVSADDPATRAHLGTTPLRLEQHPRGEYLLTIEKEGFVPAARIMNTNPVFLRGAQFRDLPSDVEVALLPVARSSPGMVLVSGGEYSLAGWSRPSDRPARLRDFLIDRYEVSNREFEEFVRAGGYRKRELWKHALLRDGRTLPFEEAMLLFRDTTALPGPRSWVGGAPPAGRENHPVTDITWYEAAAYAEWKGKKLPTVYQWEKAARFAGRLAIANNFPWGFVVEGTDATQRANFRGKGTMPVDTLPFGISPYGAHHMAGNVAEWCLNVQGPGHSTRGGAWNDAIYIFGKTAGFPATYTSPTLGFRCVKELTPGTSSDDQGAFALDEVAHIPVYEPVDDASFAAIRKRYDYQKTELHARVVEVVNTDAWRREKIEFTTGANRVASGYLYLPNGYTRPLQVIHFAPAGDVTSGWRPLPDSIESTLPALIRGGRAVFSVVMEGFYGRPYPADFVQPDSRSPEYVDHVVTKVTELRRGLDYLEARKDLDTSRIAFIGPSAGSWAGVIVTALEPRYRSVLFIGSGISPAEATDAQAANRVHFAARIQAPKLMIQGLYDEDSPILTDAGPLYRLLPEPKRMITYEGGHALPLAIMVPTATSWLDETLGPVAH